MNKKKIIHQASLSKIGGVQTILVGYLSNAIKISSYHHEICGLHKLNTNFYPNLPVVYHNIKNNPYQLLKFLYYLKSKNSIIHFQNNAMSPLVNKLLGIIKGNKIIFHEQGTGWILSDDAITTYRNNIKLADLIIFGSDAAKVIVNHRVGLDGCNTKIIHNSFIKKNSDFSYLKKKHSKKRVGFIGRLEDFKGVHVLIEAIKTIDDDNVECLIAGSGSYEGELKKIANNQANIKFIGATNKPLKFIANLDILVIPSIRDAFATVVQEAGFCNTAIIASNIDGFSEIITNNETGILLTPTKTSKIKGVQYVVSALGEVVKPMEIDPKLLASTIIELLQNKNKRKMLSENLYKTVNSKFTLESYASKLENIYAELFNEKQ